MAEAMISRDDLTQDQVRELLEYDPCTGVFRWRSRAADYFDDPARGRAWNGKNAGKVAGCFSAGDGYIKINVFGRMRQAHRLAYVYMAGSYPPSQIDHINGDRKDNRWSNLRAVTAGENRKNMKTCAHNTSGVMGVVWDKSRGQWAARIKTGGEIENLGRFDDWFDAVCAKKSAEARHGFHQNHGRRV